MLGLDSLIGPVPDEAPLQKGVAALHLPVSREASAADANGVGDAGEVQAGARDDRRALCGSVVLVSPHGAGHAGQANELTHFIHGGLLGQEGAILSIMKGFGWWVRLNHRIAP